MEAFANFTLTFGVIMILMLGWYAVQKFSERYKKNILNRTSFAKGTRATATDAGFVNVAT